MAFAAACSMRLAAQTVAATPSTSGRPAAGATRPAARACCCRRRAPGSSSSRSSSAAPQRQRRRHADRLPPPGVTNEGREVKDPSQLDPEEEKYVEVDPELPPVGQSHFGIPLERRVGLTYEDAIFKDEVDPEAMEWWFTEPQGGWPTEKRRLRKLEELPEVDEDVFARTGADAEGRIPLEAVREGQTFRGKVVAQILYHGAQIDIGAQWDALLACQGEQWEEAAEHLWPGDEVEVRVHKLRDPRFFRFPIQVAAVDARIARAVMPPDEHKAPIDVREPTMTMEEIAAATGREWTPETMVLQDQEAYDFSMGEDLFYEEQEPYGIPPQQERAMDEVVARLMGGF